jgi:hypothetical protein
VAGFVRKPVSWRRPPTSVQDLNRTLLSYGSLLARGLYEGASFPGPTAPRSLLAFGLRGENHSMGEISLLVEDC